MKHSFVILFVAIVLFAACTTKSAHKPSPVEEFRSSLTAVDSTTMLNICNEAMEKLKNKQVSEVVAGLYEYNDSTKEVRPLSESTSKRYIRRFTSFPVLDYRLVYYSFLLEGCNDVKYEVIFATSEKAGTPTPPTTTYMFNPVKVNDEWKLCVKTSSDGFDTELQ